MRAHPEPIGHYAPLSRSPIVQTPRVTTLLFVVPEAERSLYSGNQFARTYVHRAAEAARLVAAGRPRLVVIDWDDASLGGVEICAAARALPATSTLVVTAAVENVPAILKAGCQGVLLKPFAPPILAGRIGRVLKETERPGGQRPASPAAGTNRVWQDVACPHCGTQGATSFDFSSHRRMWYACLSCDATWLGPGRN